MQTLWRKMRYRQLLAGVFGVAFLAGGIATLTVGRAATSVVKSEAESGTVNGSAAAVGSQSGASESSAVLFGSTGGGQNLITRSGTKLMLNGKQYKFAGFNADTIPNECGWPGEKAATTDTNLDAFFSQMNPHSMTRVWPYMGGYDEAVMERVVKAAERHGQYLMATLSVGNQPDGCTAPPNYNDPSAMIAHVQKVVGKFKDSPAIGVWEVCNECNLNPDVTKNWNRTVTDEIRRIDPKHLITIGGMTCYTDVIAIEKCKEANDLPNNDLVSIHEYDNNNYSKSWWAADTATVAKSLNKPAFVGETGFTAPNSGNCGSQACNATNMIKKINAYIDDPDYSGILWWDFKWGSPENAVANLNTPMFKAMSDYRHSYQ